MSSKKRGLGRGLDALLGGGTPSTPAAPSAGTDQAPDDGRLRRLPVDLIQRGRYQPRMDMHSESLEDLAASIRAQGVVQPIVVRPVSDERFEIIAGERRWRAAQLAGLQDIPAVVREVEDRAAIAMALIENIQREDLNPMEQAGALQRLITEFELTHQQAAEAVGRSRAAVSNFLRLLELNDDVKELINQGALEMGHGRALLALHGSAQSEAARKVAADGLTVRQTEQLVRRLQRPSKPGPSAPRLDPNVRRLQDDLAEKLGAGVHIRHKSSGKGSLVIDYNTLDELQGILSHIH